MTKILTWERREIVILKKSLQKKKKLMFALLNNQLTYIAKRFVCR